MGTVAALLLLYDLLACGVGVARACRGPDLRHSLRSAWASGGAWARSVFSVSSLSHAAAHDSRRARAPRAAATVTEGDGAPAPRHGRAQRGSVSVELAVPSLHDDIEALYSSLEETELQIALASSLTTHLAETSDRNRSRGERRVRRYARAIARAVRNQDSSSLVAV
jgi:hypothetical protein